MERGGRISGPSEVTGPEVTGQLRRARRAVASVATSILGPAFARWLEDPPPDGLELAGDLVSAFTEADARTPEAACGVMLTAVARFRQGRAI